MVETTFNLSDFEYFLLILARISSFIFAAPFFSQQGIPPLPKVGLSCIISLLIINSVRPEITVYYSALGYGIIVFKEIICGLIIGYMASICQYIVTYAGNLIDMDIGLTMASQFDPTLNTNVTITGNIYYYCMLMLMLLSDIHGWLLRALVDTFKLMPLGGQEFEWDFFC